MTTAGTSSGASPLFAASGMSANDFDGSEFMNDDYDPLGASSPLPNLDLSIDPDTLPAFNPSRLHDPKSVVSPQATLVTLPVPAATSPDSFIDSFRDSSSDSASSKRTGSSTSARTALTAGEVMMTDGPEIKPEWNQSSYMTGQDDAVFMFGNHDSSALEDAFGANDDKFMEESFDFDSASSSPNGAGGALNMESPEMPTIQTNTPQRNFAPSKERAQGHSKNYSQFSLTQSMNGLKTSGSREVSPMSSNMITSHETSPSALFNNSPSPGTHADFSNAPSVRSLNGNSFWPSKQDMASQAMGHGAPLSQYLPGDGLPVYSPHQLPLYAQPQFNSWNGRCQLTIHPTPSKSRVETQIPIKMTLFPLPPGVTRLHLPTHTISKPKLLAKPHAERSPDMLELYTMLVCTSAMQSEDNKRKAFQRAAAATHFPLANSRCASEDDDEENRPQNGGEVRICTGCITRERKRAARKKIKKVEEEEMWNREESRRVIVFNTQEIKEWQQPSGIVTDATITGRPEPVVPNGAMQVDAPMRIACYCRHHAEKLGFQVILTIKDWQDRVVAQEMSQSIMITDDHKTHPMPAQLAGGSPQGSDATMMPLMNTPLDTSSLTAPGGPFRLSQSSSDLQSLAHSKVSSPFSSTANHPPSSASSNPRSLSRPASPTHSAPASKKRKASSSRLPIGMTMTRLDTSPPPGAQNPGNQASAGPSAATSPFTPNLSTFKHADNMFAQNGPPQASISQPYATGPPTPNSNDQVMFSNANRSASMENMAIPMFSAPTSTHPSRAPSPNGLRNSINTMPQSQFSQALASSLYSLPVGVNQSRPQPTIHKIIPNEGPKSGGIEVTILGASFYQGLEVLFGDQKATTTTFWGESSLVCLLPPSPVAGPVFVTFKQQQAQAPQSFQSLTKQQPIFKYIDDDEEKLIRTALSILGHKMSGQMVDVKELAQRILGEGDSSWGTMLGQFSGSGFSGGFKMNVESQLLKCLELIDLDDSPRVPRLDLRRSTGQTMLHLACSLGFNRFVAGLLARGANPDLRDKGGFTPMHLAAMNNHSEIVRRLIQVGADPTIRALSGLVPADVARSRLVLRAIRRCERHTRSRSGVSLHSRASSAASLRSLWDPLTMSDESDHVASGEESPEYSSGDFEDEEEEENMWLNMRRRSAHTFSPEPDLLPQEQAELQAGLASPTTALAAASAVRDQVAAQIQQFQQTMALHFPNLSQFPNLPQMPVLPDYQAYLHSAPFMRRVTSLVPGIAGSRPGSAGDEAPKGLDNRWWDLSSYMSNSTAPPPAYSDIFPQEDLDRKQASAAQAAVDAEADMKCASLYDTQTTEAEAEAESGQASTSALPIPSILKIGRKSAITRQQQQDFLRAHEAKFKGMSSDMNLWFIWIPLLTFVMAAMLYSRFPDTFAFAWSILRSVAGFEKAPDMMRDMQDRVVEIL